jgi:hypothetical protein
LITLRIHQGRLEACGANPEDCNRLVAFRDLWEERAGIMEYQGGLTRAEAESHALDDCITLWSTHVIPYALHRALRI